MKRMYISNISQYTILATIKIFIQLTNSIGIHINNANNMYLWDEFLFFSRQ